MWMHQCTLSTGASLELYLELSTSANRSVMSVTIPSCYSIRGLSRDGAGDRHIQHFHRFTRLLKTLGVELQRAGNRSRVLPQYHDRTAARKPSPVQIPTVIFESENPLP